MNVPRILRFRWSALLVGLFVFTVLLAGCSKGGGLSYNQEVDDLGADIVADLKQQPFVADATYKYNHGIDLGQHLRVRIILDQDAVSEQAIQQVIDRAAKDFWLSPADVGHISITVFSSANPPVGDNETDNKDREIGSKNIEDSEAFDRPEMERKYGPRPKN